MPRSPYVSDGIFGERGPKGLGVLQWASYRKMPFGPYATDGIFVVSALKWTGRLAGERT